MWHQQISQLEGRLNVSRKFLQSLPAGEHLIHGKQVSIRRRKQGMIVVAVNDAGRVFACGFR